MKSLLVLVLAVGLLAFTGNLLAEEKAYVPKENEELYGTWVNEEYVFKPQKYVYNSDGTWGWAASAKNEPASKTPYEIEEKWTDSEGNIWYKARMVCPDRGKIYLLHKLSDSGNKYESVWAGDKYPKKIDPDGVGYRIYYRQ